MTSGGACWVSGGGGSGEGRRAPAQHAHLFAQQWFSVHARLAIGNLQLRQPAYIRIITAQHTNKIPITIFCSGK